MDGFHSSSCPASRIGNRPFVTKEKHMNELTETEKKFIITSLEYTKKKFTEEGIAPWGNYPSYEFKQERLKEVNELIEKIKGISHDEYVTNNK